MHMVNVYILGNHWHWRYIELGLCFFQGDSAASNSHYGDMICSG